MSQAATLLEEVNAHLADDIESHIIDLDELTLIVKKNKLKSVCKKLRDIESLAFTQIIDVCGVDYLTYGDAEWQTDEATSTGFGRGVVPVNLLEETTENRFAVVYHLLSVNHNQRIRLRCYAEGQPPMVDSVIEIWSGADWFEREAFDLYGILFDGHPDLRRILTDYGFIGHPFRKDFPLSGHLEVRYDPEEARVVYQPVSIEPRVLVPKVIRDDHRNVEAKKVEEQNG